MHNQALDSRRQHQNDYSLREPAAQLIEEAVENKYVDLPRTVLLHLFDLAWEQGMAAPDEATLTGWLRRVDGPAADVANQVILLLLIERFWAPGAVLALPLQTIHSALFGLNGAKDFRTEIEVEDFDGTVRTAVKEVCARLDEIERFAHVFTPRLRHENREAQAMFLAYIFASVIRIHPFPDGNGRTARLFVQYALRCWGLPFLPLPKVRNDPRWKLALSAAIEGDVTPLAEQFKVRMMAGVGDSRIINEQLSERPTNIRMVSKGGPRR